MTDNRSRIQKIPQSLKGHEGMWFVRTNDVARWWLKHCNTKYPRPTDLIIYLQIETRKSIMARSLLGTCRVGG